MICSMFVYVRHPLNDKKTWLNGCKSNYMLLLKCLRPMTWIGRCCGGVVYSRDRASEGGRRPGES